MATVFDNVPDWPAQSAPPPDRHHNRPPLEEQVTMDFEDQLREEGLLGRIEELTESAGRAPPCDSQPVAAKIGDLLSLARTARKRVEELREQHNRPLLTAQRALKGRADGILSPMDQAMAALKRSLDAFMAEEARKAAEARRKAEEEARRLQEEAARAAAEAAERNEPAPPPPPVIEPARIAEPVVRGDLGARVGTRTVWKHEREVPITKLPKAILENEKVVAAVDQVIAAMIRGGTREIKGVRIYSEQVADVR